MIPKVLSDKVEAGIRSWRERQAYKRARNDVLARYLEGEIGAKEAARLLERLEANR